MNKPDKITEEVYKKAIKSVLLEKPKGKSENRMPTKEELNMKWELNKE